MPHMLLVLLDSLWCAAWPGGMLALSLHLRLAVWIEPGGYIAPSTPLRAISPLR